MLDLEYRIYTTEHASKLNETYGVMVFAVLLDFYRKGYTSRVLCRDFG